LKEFIKEIRTLTNEAIAEKLHDCWNNSLYTNTDKPKDNVRQLFVLLNYYQGEDELYSFLMQSLIPKSSFVPETLTIGGDPEHVLRDESGLRLASTSLLNISNEININETCIGGDYGLLEFRIPKAYSIQEFITNYKNLKEEFNRRYPDLSIDDQYYYDIDIMRMQCLEQNKIDEGIRFGQDKRRFGRQPSIRTLRGNIGATLNAYGDYCPINNYSFISCGGHIHFGGIASLLTEPQIKNIVKGIDIACADIMLSSEEKEKSIKRRQYYGRAGEFKINEHGFEYRVPANTIYQEKCLEKLLLSALAVFQKPYIKYGNEAQYKINNFVT
jgi:hypothetical protein